MVSSAGGGRNVLEFQFQEQKSLQKQKLIAIDTVELPLSDCDTNLAQKMQNSFSQQQQHQLSIEPNKHLIRHH